MIDITGKRFVILGLQGSGKTELAKLILSKTENHIVYDVLQEYDGFQRYIPTDRNSRDELSATVQKLILPRVKPDLFIIDEANRYLLPKPTPLPAGIDELNDWSRHMGKYGLSWGCIARRPTQLHTDIVELAHYLFIFVLKGKNDQQYLDSILPGLGSQVASLPDYHFVIVDAGRKLVIHSPIPDVT